MQMGLLPLNQQTGPHFGLCSQICFRPPACVCAGESFIVHCMYVCMYVQGTLLC